MESDQKKENNEDSEKNVQMKFRFPSFEDNTRTRPRIKRLCEYFPKFGKRCNILLFGAPHTGKSSLINTLLGDSEIIGLVASVNEQLHARAGKTTIYESYKFNSRISLFDIWGWEAKSYQNKMVSIEAMKSILMGNLKHGQSKSESLRVIHNVQSEKNGEIDAVILVCAANIFMKNLVHVTFLRDMYDICEAFDIPCVIALTMIDILCDSVHPEEPKILIEKDVDLAIKKIFAAVEKKGVLNYLREILFINRDISVAPVINYRPTDCGTNPIIDRFSIEFTRFLVSKIQPVEWKCRTFRNMVDLRKERVKYVNDGIKDEEHEVYSCGIRLCSASFSFRVLRVLLLVSVSEEEQVKSDSDDRNENKQPERPLFGRDLILPKHLLRYHPVLGRCNILIFGTPGAGKSSFINTLFSTDKEVKKVAQVRESTEDTVVCTKKLQKHSLTDEIGIFDTWPWCPSEEKTKAPSEVGASGYSGEGRKFRSILKGATGGRTEDGPSNIQPFWHGMARSNEAIIDIVCFVFGTDVTENPNRIMNLRPLKKICSQSGIPYFVVITKVDKFLETTEPNEQLKILDSSDPIHMVQRIHQSRYWRGIIDYVRNNLHDGFVDVLPIVNYSPSTTLSPNPVISLLTQNIVKTMVYFSERYNQRILSITNSKTYALSTSEKLFKDEKTNILRFDNNIESLENIQIMSKELLRDYELHIDDDESETSDFEIRDSYLSKVLKLGSTKWRFYMIVTSHPKKGYIGLFNADKKSFFESRISINGEEDGFYISEFEMGFDEKLFCPNYCFFSTPQSLQFEKQKEYDEKCTKYVMFSICHRKVLMKKLSRKKYWRGVRKLLVPLSQTSKDLDRISKRMNEKIAVLHGRTKATFGKLDRELEIISRAVERYQERERRRFIRQQQ